MNYKKTTYRHCIAEGLKDSRWCI